MVAMAVAAAVSVTVMPLAGQAGRGQAPAGGAAPARQARAVVRHPRSPRAACGSTGPRPDRIAGKPNFNGVWQAMGTAYWNLEDHSASGSTVLAARRHRGDPGGQSVVEGGTIPYLPRPEEAAGEHGRLAQVGSRGEVLHGGHPALDLHAVSLPDRAGAEGHSVRLRVRQLEPHRAHDQPSGAAGGQLDGLVRWQVGWRHARDRSDRQQRLDLVRSLGQPPLRSAEGHRALPAGAGGNHINYSATIEDPKTFSRPWTIRMPLYRRMEPNVQLLEFKCVEFSEELLYGI
jgi:hypothetical protein